MERAEVVERGMEGMGWRRREGAVARMGLAVQGRRRRGPARVGLVGGDGPVKAGRPFAVAVLSPLPLFPLASGLCARVLEEFPNLRCQKITQRGEVKIFGVVESQNRVLYHLSLGAFRPQNSCGIFFAYPRSCILKTLFPTLHC